MASEVRTKTSRKSADAGKLGEGDKVPDFALATDAGTEISRASLKGKPYVLYFYPRDNTSGCTREAVDFSAAAAKFAKLGVEVVGVSKDSLASHEKFREKHELKLTLASDPEVDTAKTFGVWSEKSLYGRKFMGMERATFLVDAKGTVAAAWRKVKVPGHVAAVLEAAKKL
ncbi:MAG: peroxiredoxin [Alphaproteobacteria bacterium]|nr:peroxiredoxin [Alphaproteobacteria bacterium]